MTPDDNRDEMRRRLPRDSSRLMALIEQSAPDPHRPRLPDEYEAALYEADRRRAAMYASMEDLADRFELVAERIEELDRIPGVPVPIDDEDSLVISIGEIRGDAPA